MLAISLLLCPTEPLRAQEFTVVLDAAHGGEDTGTSLSPQLLEKNWVLQFSVRLRSSLAARGIHVVTTRESDVNPAPELRASQANHAKAGACLVLHATASGTGAHLYTSSLNSGRKEDPAAWNTAQAPYVTASLELASEIRNALGSADIPLTVGRVRLPSLDVLQCPAVAVEIAPLHRVEHGKGGGEAAIDNPAYEQRVLDALLAALVAWRTERENAPGRQP